MRTHSTADGKTGVTTSCEFLFTAGTISHLFFQDEYSCIGIQGKNYTVNCPYREKSEPSITSDF